METRAEEDGVMAIVSEAEKTANPHNTADLTAHQKPAVTAVPQNQMDMRIIVSN